MQNSEKLYKNKFDEKKWIFIKDAPIYRPVIGMFPTIGYRKRTEKFNESVFCI